MRLASVAVRSKTIILSPRLPRKQSECPSCPRTRGELENKRRDAKRTRIVSTEAKSHSDTMYANHHRRTQMRRFLSSTTLLLMALISTSSSASAQDYDIVILNGRVMDPETNFDGVRNMGIKGDRIVKITEEKITGRGFD